jgi:hypothetical protein
MTTNSPVLTAPHRQRHYPPSVTPEDAMRDKLEFIAQQLEELGEQVSTLSKPELVAVTRSALYMATTYLRRAKVKLEE